MSLEARHLIRIVKQGYKMFCSVHELSHAWDWRLHWSCSPRIPSKYACQIAPVQLIHLAEHEVNLDRQTDLEHASAADVRPMQRGKGQQELG